jgi:hypothetical protein
MSGPELLSWKSFGTILLFIGILFLLVGLGVFGYQLSIRRNWIETEAEVTDIVLEQETDQEGNVLCSASYELRFVVNGQTVTTREKESSSSSNCDVWRARVEQARGTKMRILYDPANPEHVLLLSGLSASFYFLPITFAVVGIVFAVIGFVVQRLTSTAAAPGAAFRNPG